MNQDMLPSGQTGEIIKNLSLRREHILSQSEIVLPLRKTCYYSPLAEVGVFSTEIKSKNKRSTFMALLYRESVMVRFRQVSIKGMDL